MNGLKSFQEHLHDAFAAYMARCRELMDPAAAFAESTRACFGHALAAFERAELLAWFEP